MKSLSNFPQLTNSSHYFPLSFSTAMRQYLRALMTTEQHKPAVHHNAVSLSYTPLLIFAFHYYALILPLSSISFPFCPTWQSHFNSTCNNSCWKHFSNIYCQLSLQLDFVSSQKGNQSHRESLPNASWCLLQKPYKVNRTLALCCNFCSLI